MNKNYTNQYVLENVKDEPIYVQIAINPTFLQFHSPLAEDPIVSGYGRPSFAGVLTGYNLKTEGEEYWEIFIRRHGTNYNKVKVACLFEKNGKPQLPFGGMSSKMVQFKVTNTQPVDRAVLDTNIVTTPITTTDQLETLVNDNSIDTTSSTVAVYTKIFDCTGLPDGSISIAEVFPAMTTIIFIGFGDALTDYPCIDFFTDTLEEWIDMFPDEYVNGRTTRRLEEVDPDTLETKDISFVGKNLVSIKFGDNKYNTYKYNFIIKGMIWNC